MDKLYETTIAENFSKMCAESLDPDQFSFFEDKIIPMLELCRHIDVRRISEMPAGKDRYINYYMDKLYAWDGDPPAYSARWAQKLAEAVEMIVERDVMIKRLTRPTLTAKVARFWKKFKEALKWKEQ